MKHVKLFEEWTGKLRMPTLRHALDPDNYESAGGADPKWILTSVEWTCAALGISSTVKDNRMASLGLLDARGKLMRMDLDRAVLVYEWSRQDVQGNRELLITLADEYPKLFKSRSVDGPSLEISREAFQPDALFCDQITDDLEDPDLGWDLHAYKDPDSDVVCVLWETSSWTQIWMLVDDLPK